MSRSRERALKAMGAAQEIEGLHWPKPSGREDPDSHVAEKSECNWSGEEQPRQRRQKTGWAATK